MEHNEMVSDIETIKNKIITMLEKNKKLLNEQKNNQPKIQYLENELQILNEKYKKIYSEKGSLYQRLNITSKSLDDTKIENIALKNELSNYNENNKILIEQNKILSNQLYKLQNTDNIIQDIMKKHNSWWVMDSVEEKVYRKVLLHLQEYIQET